MERELYTLPDAATIVTRLSAVDGTESDALSVVHRFAEKLANREVYAMGINLAWELAIYDISRRLGAVPMLSFLMSLRFDEYMAALLPDDAEFLAEMQAIRAEMKSR